MDKSMSISVNIKKLSNSAKIPEQATKADAGFDLCADIVEPLAIYPHETKKIPTGIAMSMPTGYWAGIFARSGIATKRSLAPANKVGVVDCGYRGEIMVALHNHSDHIQFVEAGEKIAQIVFLPCVYANFIEVDTLDETERGIGGFGSTGTV